MLPVLFIDEYIKCLQDYHDTFLKTQATDVDQLYIFCLTCVTSVIIVRVLVAWSVQKASVDTVVNNLDTLSIASYLCVLLFHCLADRDE